MAQAKAKNLDGQEASVKAEVAAAIAEAEALVANGSASQDQVNQSVERLTQALASVKEVTAVVAETASETTTESSETPKVRNKRATTEGTARSVDETRLDRVTVTKDNFDSYFKEGGTASYDETSGIIRLTEDTNSQAGNAYLRFKIDPKEDFTFTGKVDVGDKYEGHGVGGDGVGFVFHTGEVSKLGQTGASVGMGQIPAAFGFKLDTYHNTNNPNAAQNSIADPKYGGLAYKRNAFGAFYSSNNAGKVNTIGDAKALSPEPSGQLVDFKISYIGRTKDFTVTYGGQTWSTNLETARAGNNTAVITSDAKTALNKTNATYALSFVASTGGATNLQRVQIEKFEFTAPQIVQVDFYDEAGNKLAARSAIPGDRDQVVNLSNIEAVQKVISKLEAKGYTLKEVNSKKAETYNAGANTVRLRSGGQLLKYVFKEKEKQAASIQAPTNKVPVKNTTALTDDEKSSVEAAVKAVNPKASKVEVATDGAATVTFEDGSTATLTGDQTVKAADANGVKAPTTKTPVQNTSALTQPEKDAVKKAVETANPSATKVEVGNDGSATVTFPDGTTATLTGDKTVKEADSKGVKAPTNKVPVQNTSALTQPEKDAVKKAVEGANPSATKVEVGNDGSATVTFPDGTTATLTGDKTVKEADSKGVQEPAAKTPVKDTSALTDEEKTQVAEEIVKANPTLEDVDVANDGTATVTFPDGSTATLTPAQTVVKAEEKAKDADGLKAPATKTPVKDTANLTDAEKAEVKKAVEAANPGTVAEVGQDGTTKVTFPDKSEGTLTGDQTVKAADANGAKAPEAKTPVQNTSALTQPEKDAVKKAVEDANPGSKAEVGQDGTTTVTFPDGSTATLTGDQTVKTADSNGVQAPSTKTPVKDTANLTDVEKAKVKEAVEAANPGSKAEVGQDGSTKVTFPDGSTATLTGDKTVTKADITAPTAPVVNPVKAGDTAVTGTAEAGSTVEVILPDGSKVSAKADKDGKFSVPVSGLHAGDTVSVTATDESGNTSATTTVTVSNVNVGGKDADNAKVPVLTPVVDPNNLTDAEKAKVAEEVKKVNPTATDVKVNNDGSVVVTFADGSVATIAANKVVKEATKESSAQAPAKKAGAKELPNTGTKQSNASLGLALLAAVTGGLLISKKRKEEE